MKLLSNQSQVNVLQHMYLELEIDIPLILCMIQSTVDSSILILDISWIIGKE
jgi:hypothetical protein